MQRGWFRRLLLPGLAFKAVVIGGGYATGREMATFFAPAGAVGGIYAIATATLVWSAVCALTFLFARQTASFDYRSFFGHLLGPFWPIYEIAYLLALILILAAYAAAAGSIVAAISGWPVIAGTLALMALVTVVATCGSEAVERLFKYVSFLLYGAYLAFVILGVSRFGPAIRAAFASPSPDAGWFAGGVTYAGYNIIGAAVILPVARHLTSRRDAIVAGLLAGPLAMIPALAFFVCMTAYLPGIVDQPLPADFLLAALHAPGFRLLFQAMVFCALLESSTGGVHAINERIARLYRTRSGRPLSGAMRFAATALTLSLSVFVASRFGLVALIASGYRWLAYTFLLIYVLPLATIGLARMIRAARAGAPLPILSDA